MAFMPKSVISSLSVINTSCSVILMLDLLRLLYALEIIAVATSKEAERVFAKKAFSARRLAIKIVAINYQSTLTRVPPWALAALTPEAAMTFFSETSSVGKPSSAAFATASARPLTPAF